MSLAKAIEYHVDAFVEHSISPSPPTLVALKISRRNLTEAAVRAILRNPKRLLQQYPRQSGRHPGVTP
jgi:hypothetical protein